MATEPMIDVDFIQQIRNNLRYWQAQAEALSDETGATFAPNMPGVIRAIQYGLRLPQTATATAELVAETFEFIQTFHYWEPWRPVLQETWALPDLPPALHGTLGIQLGQLSYLTARYEEAGPILQQTLSLAQEHGLAETISAANYHLANLALEQAQFEDARRYATVALDLFQQHHQAEPRRMAAVHNLMGRIAQATGDDERAIAYLDAALPYWQQAGDLIYELYNLSNIGMSYNNLNRPEEALAYYDQAAELARRTDNEMELGRISLNRGTVYYRQEQWAAAEAAYRAGLTRAVLESDYHMLKGALLASLASVLVEQERGDEADPYLEQAVPLWRDLNHKTMLANALIVQGRRELLREAAEPARQNLTEAIAILRQVPDDAWGQRLLARAEDALSQASGSKNG